MHIHAKLLVCLFYYTSSIFDILIALALLDLKVPISLKPDWIQLCLQFCIQSIIKEYRGRET